MSKQKSHRETLEEQYATLEQEYKEIRRELVQADEQLIQQQAKVNNLLKLKREIGEALREAKLAIHKQANPNAVGTESAPKELREEE